MEKKIIGLCVLVLVAIGLLAGISGILNPSIDAIGPFSTTTGSGSYSLVTELPRVPDLLPIYQIRQDNISKITAESLARKMGIEGNIRNIGGDVWEITDSSKEPSERIEVFTNSGSFRYSIPDKLFRDLEYQPILPNSNETRAIAEKFLIDRGLLPEDFKFKEVIVGLSQGEYSADNPKPVTHHNLVLYAIFERFIQEIPTTEGITVWVGENGEIVGLTYKNRELEDSPIRYVKIIQPELAYQNLIEGKCLIRASTDSLIDITNVSLKYYFRGERQSQRFVLPVYEFSGIESGEQASRIVRYVPAIDPKELNIPPLNARAYFE